ncbi:relaxin receptor 1 [Lasius niger]|uniref:Relaxin receptor 1 n=1 Tax=Lasius niger TaxID=67767 RepID=A0A0J7NZE0_LASNI|nr:relaxin receptor 1 [Lasius niger]
MLTASALKLPQLPALTEINLAYNRIVKIPSNVFQPVNNLSKLLIGYNPIVELPMTLFNPLKNLRSLYFKKFHYCMTYAPKVQKCRPISDVIHWRSSTRYYGVNGMCFPLHIDDPYLIGWEYSAFIFLGLNLLGLMIIGYVYAAMFASIWRTRHATPLSVGDSEFALRFFLIVLTDAACWAPIIGLKILAMMNYPVPRKQKR